MLEAEKKQIVEAVKEVVMGMLEKSVPIVKAEVVVKEVKRQEDLTLTIK